MNMKLHRTLLPICSSLFMMPAHSALFDALEEVYVSAQKSTQSTQDIGIAISAFTGEAIQDLGLANPMDLSSITPGLSTANAVSDSIPIFSIRGVGLDDFNANNTGGVGVYVDEVFVTSPAMMSFQLFDLERVEVLKGPQGTIYGRNTTGGAINFISKKPSTENEVFITVDYSRFEKVDVTGAVSGSLNDDLKARVAIKYIDQGEGYKTDVASGDEIGKTERWAVRTLVDWSASDSTDVMFNLRAGADTSESAPWHSDDSFGLGGAGGFLDFLSGGEINYPIASPSEQGKSQLDGIGFTQVGGSDKPKRDDDFWGLSVTATVAFDTMELTSITAYDEYSRDSQEFYDGSPASINDQWFKNEIDAVSQEFRLSSDDSDDYSWLVGMSYGVDNVESEDLSLVTNAIDAFYLLPSEFGGFGLPYVWTPSASGYPSSLVSIYEQETKAAGLFGQTEIYLNDEFTLTLGLRYSQEERSFDGQTIDNEGFILGIVGPGVIAELDESETESNTSGKIALNWAPNDDLLVYASASTGFKSGVYFGSPVASQGGMGYVEPEEITAFEAGFKATLLDGKVRLNGSAFQYKYDDKQILVTADTPTGAAPTLANAPETEVDGFELEMWASPAEGLSLQLTGSYIHSKLTKELNSVRGLSLVGGPIQKGEELSLSPDWSYNGLVRYDWNIGSELTAYFQTNYSWQDDTISLVADPNGAVDTISSLDARFAIASADEDWEIAVWGRNLEGEDDVTYAYTNVILDRSYSRQYPRTYGVSATYNW